MSSDWLKGRLGDFIELKRGYDLPKTKREPGTVPLVSSSGESDTHSQAMVKGPGVVTGRYGTIGQVFYIKKDFWPLNTTLYVRNFKGNDPRFISYFLKTLNFDAYSDKGAVPGVNRNHLHEAEVLVPSLKLQRKIAKILEDLDDSIDTLQHQNTALEAIAQRLFRSWFVNFDPVHAKAAGNAPEAMSAELAALFPSEFEDSELGAIPKGWTVTTLGEAFYINPRRSLAKESMAPHLEMANVGTEGHCPTQRVPLRPFGSGTKYINGDTLLARITPCLENGKTAFVDFLHPNQVGWGSTEFIVIRSKEDCPQIWSYLLARQAKFRAFAIKAMTGTSGRQRVDVSTLQTYPLVMPEVKLSRAAAPVFDSIRKQMTVNAEISLSLAELRDHLLPHLISGKLSLAEAEHAIAEVTGTA